MDDKIILLRKNGKMSVCNVKDVVELTKKHGDVVYVLIDVGMYTNEYLMIPREKFIRKFKYAEIRFCYHIEVYTDGLTCSTDPRPGVIICNNVLEFYRAVHSIQKLNSSALIMHDDFYAVSYENKLSQVDLLIRIGKDTQHICIETSTQSTSMHDVNYVLETINYMVYGNPSISVIPDISDNPKALTVDTNKMYWKMGPHDSNIWPMYLNTFKCWTFLPCDDYDLMKTVEDSMINLVVYVPIRQGLTEDMEVTAENIHELDGMNLEVIFERDLILWNSCVEGIVEFIQNAKYLFMARYVELQAQYGDMEEDLILILSYRFKSKLGPKYDFRPTFSFTINRQMVESDTDIYKKFTKSLHKNFMMFKEGLCSDE